MLGNHTAYTPSRKGPKGTPFRASRAVAGLGTLALLAGLIWPCGIGAGARQEPGATQEGSATQGGPVYDGNWWLMLDGEEQAGFVSGYQDCYVSEYHGGGIFSKEIQSYADDLNKYFLGDATRQKQSVSEALDAVRGGGTDVPLPAYKAANPPPADQAVYDGRYWQDADTSTRLGFVEGYRVCHAAKLRDADAKFSKAPSDYVDGINRTYQSGQNTGDTPAGKLETKIADALHSLKDPESSPTKPAPEVVRPRK